MRRLCVAITRDQQQMLLSIEQLVLQARKKKRTDEDIEGVNKLSFVNSFPARDRAFLQRIASDLYLTLTWDEYDDQDQNLAVLRLPPQRGGEEEDGESSEEDMEGTVAVDRVLRRYKKMKILEDEGTAEERYEAALKGRMEDWKRNYYRVSLNFLLC